MSNGLLRWTVGSVLAAAAPALAADTATDRGWFLEAGVSSVDSSGTKAQFTFDGEEPGWVLSGGYQLNRHFAVLAGYHSFGEHFATDCPAPLCTAVPHDDLVDIEGVSIAALGTWQITSTVDLFGKVGVLGWDADYRVAGFDDSDRSALYGAGVGIRVSPRWRLNVQYERVDFDLESAALGATYRF